MPLIRSREAAVAVAGLALAVALSAIATILGPSPADNLPPGSSLSKGPEGTAAAYLTLQGMGYRVQRSVEPIASLNVDAARTIVILAEPGQDASAADRRAVQRLAAAGATVLATGCRGGSFFFEGPPLPTGVDEPRQFTALVRSPLTADAPSISMAVRCLASDPAGRFLPLYGGDGKEVAGVWRVGTGMAIWWAANTPISNMRIDAPGHLELLLNAIGPPGRTVLWDEFYHGQQRSLYSYAKGTPLPWVFAQLTLVGAIAAIMYVRRRGPIIEQAVDSRISPLEFVDTMGALYGRADTAADAIATARARLRRLLIERTGLAASAEDTRVAAAAAARLRIDATDVSSALAAADRAADDGPVSPDQALAIVRQLQALSARLERSGG